MKICVSGKGGVGKTTLVAGLAQEFKRVGSQVILIDADPDANLAYALGIKNAERIVPIIEMKELIAERTGTQTNFMGGIFKLNPQVSDIPDKYLIEKNGIKLMVMGGKRSAGSGCYCPENAFLKALLHHLFIDREEVLILDMPAGTEHLSRATASAVDALIVVVEPTTRSIETSKKIKSLARDLGIRRIVYVGNKVKNEEDKKFITSYLHDEEIIGFISFNENILQQDKELPEDDSDKKTISHHLGSFLEEVGVIKDALKRGMKE